MENIARDTHSKGETPAQTLSRVLQELRDEDFVYFLERGDYLLTDSPVPVDEQDLSVSDLDGLLDRDRLAIGAVDTADPLVLRRCRMGQQRLRTFSLGCYDHMCAFCDVRDERLLVAGHIVRWSDDAAVRGRLDNVICLCRFHDPLFETGYMALDDDYTILKKPGVHSGSIRVNLDTASRFRPPLKHPPAPEYLLEHRRRTGFAS
ncbi:MAG: hypothetical protein JW909_03645 [Planctomycetes bacterium]|nr:hypothetical protein [Planctomycetota bacterium]